MRAGNRLIHHRSRGLITSPCQPSKLALQKEQVAPPPLARCLLTPSAIVPSLSHLDGTPTPLRSIVHYNTKQKQLPCLWIFYAPFRGAGAWQFDDTSRTGTHGYDAHERFDKIFMHALSVSPPIASTFYINGHAICRWSARLISSPLK